MDSTLYWGMPPNIREFYQKQVNDVLGYVPTPFLRPRERDLEAFHRGKAEHQAGRRPRPEDLPTFVLPDDIPEDEKRENIRAVKRGDKFGW